MSSTGTIAPPAYLPEARKRAGYPSREVAAVYVPYSPEAMGRHERGDVQITPQDALLYAESYGAPDILPRFCATCPIGKRVGMAATDRELPHAALRIRRMAAQAKAFADQLEDIVFDGQIAEDERPAFADVLAYLRQLRSTIDDLLLYDATNNGGQMESRRQ